ncbi:MAG: D-alanyl-D-alanine carboxypeptidase [Ruminococcus sp.]|nr:D-alanyl-D-alanine carboxypeptidase [Ruminococcus sp.]
MMKANRKGGAAVVAVLIMIMLVAIGAAAMVVTGRKSIPVSKTTTAPMPDGYDTNSIPEDDSSSDDSDDSGAAAVTPDVPKPSVLPQIANTYEIIHLDDPSFNSAVLLNCDTNEIEAGMKYDKKIYPASLTKLMTLLVAVENIEDMDATYKFTEKDLEQLYEDNASMAGFEPGEKVTMKDLLYAAILESGADGTVGLANAVAGSEEEFVELMNAKVTELGLSGTHFVNASGLHNKEHYSTTQDLAAITKACLDNDICREILFADTYTTSKTKEHPDGIELMSIFHGKYLGYFIDYDQDGYYDEKVDAEIEGGKTGFTDEAGYSMATIAKLDKTEYVCIVTKCKDDTAYVQETIAIYENYLPGAVGTPEPEEDEDNYDDSYSDDESSEKEVADEEA